MEWAGSVEARVRTRFPLVDVVRGMPYDAGEDLLGVGALAGAVAAAHLADDDGGPDGLFGAPVGGVDRRVPQEREEGVEIRWPGARRSARRRPRAVARPWSLRLPALRRSRSARPALQGVLHLTDPPAVGMLLQQMLTPSK